jgi:diguanylate cyclase
MDAISASLFSQELKLVENLASSPIDNEKLLYKLVIQFLIFNQNDHKSLEPHLLQISNHLKKGANLNELGPELQSLSKTLLHISKQAKQQIQLVETEDASSEHYAYLQQSLEELLKSATVPLQFHQQATILKQRTQAGFKHQSYKKVIDSAITLLLNIRAYTETEQQGLDSFLTSLTHNLSHIEQQIDIARRDNRLSIDNRENLNAAMNQQVDSFKDAALSAIELNSLKSLATENLDRLMLQLIAHKAQEDERQEQAQQQIEAMTQKLQALETETESLRTKLKIEHDKALGDSLTGLPNRMAYNARLELEFNRWKRHGTPLSLAIWDIDYFKGINDTYGHKAGDKTLTLVGQLLFNNCRETDFIARYGGEEFVMILPSTFAVQALEMAENIRVLIQKCGFNFNGKDIKLTLCCGISEFKLGDQHEDVFIRADQALYLCKQAGRNRCAVYSSDSGTDKSINLV